MGRGTRVFKAVLGAVLFVGVICFLSVAVSAHRATRTTVLSHQKWDSIGRGRHRKDFHIVIKRRVPNGPDPIHNRRASLSRGPPGRT